MLRLTDNTVVADHHGMAHLLREGDPLPEWAVGKVGDHILKDDEDVEPAFEPAADAADAGGDGGDGGDERPGPPPLAGPGSGADAWLAYARSFDPPVEVADDAKRPVIVEAVRQAGHPVE